MEYGVREYALGKQDVNKYKKLMETGNDNSWVKIDWQLPKKMLRHFRTKMTKKFRQSIKNYCMVTRLKK